MNDSPTSKPRLRMIEPFDNQALVQRLREHADLHDDLSKHSIEQLTWANDLRTAANLLETGAAPEPSGDQPVAWHFEGKGFHKVDVVPHGGAWKPLYERPSQPPRDRPINERIQYALDEARRWNDEAARLLAERDALTKRGSELPSAGNRGEKSEGLHSDHRVSTQARSSEGGIGGQSAQRVDPISRAGGQQLSPGGADELGAIAASGDDSAPSLIAHETKASTCTHPHTYWLGRIGAGGEIKCSQCGATVSERESDGR